MATIKFKRGATDTTGTLASGEPALNTASKKLWVGYDDTNKVWVGAEIEATMASPTSALKLTTQKGIVDYIAGLGYGSGSGDMLLGTVQTVTGVKTFNSGTLKYAGSTSGTTILNATAVAGTTTLVLPAADDTLVGKQTTDTLTNKTIAAASNTITGLTNTNLSGTAGISNANLANSTVVIGSTTVTLGAAATTTIAGLTSVSSTGFTGALTGNASTATALATTRAIYGNNFDGSAALTGAIAGTYGGTGVNNGANTITVAGNLSHAGAFTQTFTATGNTSVTLPTTGTLATLTGSETLTNKTLTTPKIAQINDTNGLAVLKTGTTASAVNEVTITNNITAQAPHVSATGSDTNISLHLAPKGTGKYVVVENGTDGTKQLAFGVAGATTATTTFLNAAQTADRTITLPDLTDTLVGKQTTDTLTNKTIAAGSNTITGLTNTQLSGTAGISNANLANSAVVIGSTSVSLGATVTTFAGLTSVTSTGFTGALTGNASTATALATTRAIYGNNFDGSAALTGAIAGTYGGTGVNNGANTITVAGNLSHAGAFTQTFTATGNTSVTLPTTGTLATLTGTETLTNKTLTTPNIGAATGTSLVLSGDLTVNGITTTINSSTLTVNDKNIELGSVSAEVVSTTGTIATVLMIVNGSTYYTSTITGMSSTSGLIPGQTITATNGTGGFGAGTMTVSTIASSTSITVRSTLTFTAGTVTNITGVAANDATANGGGITLMGATDKTIIWDSTNANWTLSENVNIPTGKVFKINNTSVLSATTLGSAVVSSSLTSVGTIATGTWQGTAIADTYISSAATWNTASTDRLKWDGGATGLVAATGRTSLGLVIGTNVQAWDADLDAVANGTYAGDDSITTVGTVTVGTIDGGTYV